MVIHHDFGESVTVGSVSLAWHQGDIRRFTVDVQVSGTGSSWATVLAGARFTDHDARYVRIVGHGNTTNEWTCITEHPCSARTAPAAGTVRRPPTSSTCPTGTSAPTWGKMGSCHDHRSRTFR
ncbi:MAG: hypothetical protein ACRDSK_07250 [Actinophytocola sp.]|uniref:hypothetical protein n=1 Tax=Actinophytocola sp. TaxID=1872138 RepID=UPI003D6B4203